MMYPENMRPSDVIEASWFEEYEKQRDVICRQLVELNCSLFLMERIAEFPFHIFLPGPATFWALTLEALMERCTMIIWRVIVEDLTDVKEKPKILTLRNFKDQIRNHLRDDNMKEILSEKFNDFESKIGRLKVKVNKIRHNHIAHLNKQTNINPSSQSIIEYQMNIAEMKKILDISTKLFDALCFNNGCLLWPINYSDQFREERKTDIDRLLDSVARESDILNLPKDNPTQWEIIKLSHPKNWIATVNEYRRKFGMDEA